MRVLFFDTETTGLPLWKEPSDHPDQPHVVDLSCELWNDETLAEEFDCLINPGVPIPPELTEIHGISDEMVQADGIAPVDAWDRFKALVGKADLLCGHNVSFDIRMMRILSARHLGLKWEPMQPTFCTMRKSTNICQIPSRNQRYEQDWKWPNLSEAIRFFFDEEHSDAHRAKPDVVAARRIFFHLKNMES